MQGTVALGVKATEVHLGAVVGAGNYATTGNADKLFEAEAQLRGGGNAVVQELTTTVNVAREAYSNPSPPMDAATELGIHGTSKVLGGV